MATSCTMVVARNRLVGCRAFVVVNTKRTMFGLANMNGNRALPNGAAPGTASSLLFAPREAAALISRELVQNRAVRYFSGGDVASESSSPPPGWNLPVSLVEYVALGPRYRQQRQQQQQHEDWLAEAADLAASLGIDPPTSIESQHRRVFHLYLPVYFWLKELLAAHCQGSTYPSASPSPSPRDLAGPPAPSEPEPPCVESGTSESNKRVGGRTHCPPLVVGISAPQGCGKTTLVSEMKRMLENVGYSCVVVSIDDFYLTGAEQVSTCTMFAEFHETRIVIQ